MPTQLWLKKWLGSSLKLEKSDRFATTRMIDLSISAESTVFTSRIRV